ncbi:GspE/PulE family protein [Robbsia sp. KACC 23696]|uniref:GspE/PulE family protein n=1 Tax=Robbsia sp. KACC 23696 TaxID=3149231 RepID=UPI00325A8871
MPRVDTHQDPRTAAGEAPVVHWLDRILADARARRASDLHFERSARGWRLRLRIDGVLHDVPSPPLHLRDALLARIKTLAGLDIAEHRRPQDGRLAVPRGPAIEDAFRVSTLPTIHGEKLVLRRLESLPPSEGLAQLGLAPAQVDLITTALSTSHGMIVLTGPTGSGKSLTLFSMLQTLQHDGINICTVEDPVEIRLPGANQVSIRDKTGLDFATVLRALLRQDPDVIMIGEIRDAQTADIAIQAAQTGHRVLSTLHTNDAPSTVTRLRDLGIAPYRIADTLQLVAAQRLLRRLCPACRRADPHNTGEWRAGEDRGCTSCGGIGFRGRIAAFQLMTARDLHTSHTDRDASETAPPLPTLHDAAFAHVANGLTTREEMRRVLGPGDAASHAALTGGTAQGLP